MHRTLQLLLALTLLAGSAVVPAAAGLAEALEALPERHRLWYREVELLLSPEEREAFFELERDYQRDAYIRAFWAARDPYPETERNELREAWQRRLEFVREEFGGLAGDRSRIFLLNGEPYQRRELECAPRRDIGPLEIWRYLETDQVPFDVYLLFFQRDEARPFELWRPALGFEVLFNTHRQDIVNRCRRHGVASEPAGDGIPTGPLARAPVGRLSFSCVSTLIALDCGELAAYTSDSEVVRTMRRILLEEELADFEGLIMRLEANPPPREREWLATFAAYSTDLPAGASTFPAELAVSFPERDGARTVVRGELVVPSDELETVTLGGERTHDLVLTGEVLLGSELLESFRYRFEVPAERVSERGVPLVFARPLRPGTYRLVLKLEDLHGGRFARLERSVEVPAVEATAPSAAGTGARRKASPQAPTGPWSDGEEPRIELADPGEGPLRGLVRFDALALGEEAIDRVAFFLDGAEILSRTRPPYTVELDLGEVPRLRTIRVEAYGEDGAVVAADEVEVNAGRHRFRVRLVEPGPGVRRQGPVMAKVEVTTPQGESVERVELWLGERRLATFHQPPFLHPVSLPEGGAPTYLRAVAYLADGRSSEDLVTLNTPGPSEEISVRLVEIYATVLDTRGHAVTGVPEAAFRVAEDGVPQEILRFAPVSDRPLTLAVLLDTSASMEDRLRDARRAAVGFLESVLEPRDRAAVMAFNDRPLELASFTHDAAALSRSLSGIKAERGTALHDSLVAALYRFNGLEGQRAILLLTDGKDESSRHDFETVLRYARVAGVVIYTIGLDLPAGPRQARRQLSKLAEETGGRSFFIDGTDELDAVYESIEEELRSQYLLVYHSPNPASDGKLRRVEVTVDRPGLTVKALRGYIP